jgi:lipopolysaccharide export system ATP-binding protein
MQDRPESTVGSSPSRPTLEARALRWVHAGRPIVDGISLTLRAGEIVGLLGPNGAGKTVTMTMVAGLLRPTSGTILINEEDVTPLPLHKRARLGLGYLPQERSVFRHLSALDNIALVLEARGSARDQARESARRLLLEFGLEKLADRAAAKLSGGEQRRLEVARSLAIQPRFLLFDEPFTGIDPLTIEILHGLLVSLRDRGVGVLLTDHNVQETLSLCDRAYVLHRGRVLAEGAPASLASHPEVRRVFLGEDFEAA